MLINNYFNYQIASRKERETLGILDDDNFVYGEIVIFY